MLKQSYLNRPEDAGIIRCKRPSRKPTQLNVTSLVDMFTILLIFLLVNFSSEEAVQSEGLELPDSAEAQGKKRPSVPVSVTADGILVDGGKVIAMHQLLAQAHLDIPELVAALEVQRERALHLEMVAKSQDDEVFEQRYSELGWQGRVTLSADENTPFEVLERVIYSCGQAAFGQVALAMNKTPESEQ